MERPLHGSSFGASAHARHGFSIGAVYNRKHDIHDRLGGQRQRGISTSSSSNYIFLFTNQRGKDHGYRDFFDGDGHFHYHGEGLKGDMKMSGRNEAIRSHVRTGKVLLVFLGLGTGLYRYLGEFIYDSHYFDPRSRDTVGEQRNAIVFRLKPLYDEAQEEEFVPLLPPDSLIGITQRDAIVAVRTKQALFRRRLSTVERACRLTGVMDMRFLRASHIKPWSQSSDSERLDENNGLLLTPSADLLFDHGWVSFQNDGRLIVATGLPEPIKDRLGLDLRSGRHCGAFTPEQGAYLMHHRDCILGHKALQDRLASVLFD